MDFQVVSDMHLDMRQSLSDVALPKRKAPILSIAGDLASGVDPQFGEMLQAVAEPFDAVLFVPGNHEHYGGNMSPQKMDERIEQICSRLPNVIFLNKRRIDIRGVAYIGATLWTNCPNDDSLLNDFGHIDGGRFTPQRENAIHREHRDWIRKAVKQAKKDDCFGAVVITHHAPDMALSTGVQASRAGALKPFYFASDMADLARDPFIQVWHSGHTHEAYKMRREPGGTLYVSNAMGYQYEKTGYSTCAAVRI